MLENALPKFSTVPPLPPQSDEAGSALLQTYLKLSTENYKLVSAFAVKYTGSDSFYLAQVYVFMKVCKNIYTNIVG